MECTSNVRKRISLLVRAYKDKLKSGNDESLPEDPTINDDKADFLKRSVLLAHEGFKCPPKYFFVETDKFPTHCFHLDLWTYTGYEEAIASSTTPEYLRKVLATPENLLWMFLNQSGSEELREIPDMQRIHSISQNIGSKSYLLFVSSKIAESMPKINLPMAVTVFGTDALSSSVILSRMYVIMLGLLPLFTLDDMTKILSIMVNDQQTKPEFARLLRTLTSDFIKVTVQDLHSSLSMKIKETQDDEKAALAEMIQFLADANFSSRESGVPYTIFYANYDVFEDNESRIQQISDMYAGKFSVCNFPSLLDASFKSLVMRSEAKLEYSGAIRDAVFSSLLGPIRTSSFLLQLDIDRDNLLQSALIQIQANLYSLRKPLRVKFVNEEGIDEGGLRKEFFQLITRALFDTGYNMFKHVSDRLWIVPDVQNSDNRREFWLIGIVLGLAIYNNILVDVAFPRAMFNKLLGIHTTFSDLEDLDPELAKGLQQLLEFEETLENGTVEDVYDRKFIYTHEVFDSRIDVPLCPDGEHMNLTIENRVLYVKLMIDYLLNVVIQENYAEFSKGFDRVCSRTLMKQLRPEELELLICGYPVLDFNELQKYTTYDSILPTDDLVVMLWNVLHLFTDAQKRNFLRFCTGSNRVPVGGLKELKFIVGVNGDGDNEMLPIAHTCFNHFLIPRYKDKDMMQTKILLAIQNCEGFGLR